MEEHAIKFGVAWFKPEQWDQLREISDDKDALETDYETWRQGAQELLQDYESRSIQAEAVIIDINEYSRWCEKHKLKFNAESRALYATEELRRRHKTT